MENISVTHAGDRQQYSAVHAKPRQSPVVNMWTIIKVIRTATTWQLKGEGEPAWCRAPLLFAVWVELRQRSRAVRLDGTLDKIYLSGFLIPAD